MKKTQLIELLNIIKTSKVSFFAIFMFVALGISVFAGMGWSGRAFENSLDSEFARQNFRDIEIAFPYGFDSGDMEKIKSVDGVTDVAGGYSTCQFFNYDGEKYQAKILSITDRINKLSQVDGKIPVKAGEVAVEKVWAEEHNLKIGDTIRFKHDDDGSAYFLSTLLDGDFDYLSSDDYKDCGMKVLNDDTYRVTAFCESPAYSSAFPLSYGSSSTTSTQINCIMFVSEKAFDKEAFTGYTSLFVKIDNLAKYNTYSDEYDKASGIYKDKIEKVANKIASEKCNRISEAKEDCVWELQDKLDSANSAIRNAESKINKAKKKLKEIKNPKPLPGMVVNSDYKKIYNQKRKQLKSEERKLSRAKSDYNEGVSNLADLQDGLDEIKDYNATILTRDNNPGVTMSEITSDMFEKMKYNMASLFLIIGLLVCYSAISRLIFNHSTLIGTKKALGFSSREISKTYLYYAGIAAVLGSVCGLLVARFVIEKVFVSVLKANYIFSSIESYISYKEAFILAVLEIVLTLLMAYMACHKVLRSSSVDLLSEKIDSLIKGHFYEKWTLWERISVFRKVAINNFFNDGKRIFAMLIGIAGCTSLIVCAVSFNDTVNGSFVRHYDKVQKYDSLVYFEKEEGKDETEIKSVLEDNDLTYAPVYTAIGSIKTPDGKSSTGCILVYDDKEIVDLFKLYSLDGKKHELEDDIWINCAYPEHFGLKNGDKIKYIDSETQEREFTMGGSYEYYLLRCQIAMSKSVYEKNFGKKYEPNAYAFNANGKYDSLVEKFKEKESYILADDFYTTSKEGFDVVASVTHAVVAVYLVLALIMALLIILNLLIMFIEEKKKELITLMTNGYSVKKVKKYIYYDTIILTVVGMLIGTVVGIVLGKWNADSIMSYTIYFINEIDIRACVLGIAITSSFTLGMSLISLRRIKNFKLSDLNKA